MDWRKANKYIPKNLKDNFKIHMQSHIMKGIQTFEKQHKLSILEKLDDIEIEVENEVSTREYLKKQLFTKLEEKIEYEEPKYENIDEAIKFCKQSFRFIDSEKIKSKKYYFDLGQALSKIKETYRSKMEFMRDIEEKLERKKTIIYKYLSFYNICMEFKNVDLVNCNLTFGEILRNKKMIKSILNS